MAFDNGQVVLDGDAARIDLETRQQLDHGHRLVQLVPFTIQGNAHGNLSSENCSSGVTSAHVSVARVCRASQGKLLMAIGLCE